MQVAKKLMLFYVEQDGLIDLSTPACLQHYKVWRTHALRALPAWMSPDYGLTLYYSLRHPQHFMLAALGVLLR